MTSDNGQSVEWRWARERLAMWRYPDGSVEYRLAMAVKAEFERRDKEREEFRTTIGSLLEVIDGLVEQQAMPDDFWKVTADKARTLVGDST
jgi:hypothetical protein